MLGWLILFGFFALCGLVSGLSGISSPVAVKIAGYLFTLLFVLGMLACAARSRAR